jgi:COMPASS component SWD3
MNGPGGGNTIRPLSVLEGHGDGPVYDVKWSGEGMVSAAEDGTCGVWGIEGDKDDCEVHG